MDDFGKIKTFIEVVDAGSRVSMRMIRSRLISLLLTLVVGLGLASSAFAHRLPTSGELQLQALQAIGLTQASICGDLDSGKGHAPCADETCGLCSASAATEIPVADMVHLVIPRVIGRLVWPEETAAPTTTVAFGPPGQAPPFND